MNQDAPATQQSAGLNQRPSVDQIPFRFFDLPKDVRLMVYDLLPTPHIHHYAISTSEGYSLKILHQRLSSLPILLACRFTHAEAAPHLKTANDIHNTNNPTLRIIVNWCSLGGATMKSVLKCAAKGLDDCKGSDQLRLLLPERDLPADDDERVEEAFSAQMGDCVVRNLRNHHRPLRHVACDFRSHEELHELLRCHSVGGAPRKIEIAVACPGVMQRDLHSLVGFWWVTREWFRCMSQDNGKEVAVRLRLMPGDEGTQAVMEPWYEMLHREWREKGEELELGTWGYELGTWVGKEEYAEAWEKTDSVRNK